MKFQSVRSILLVCFLLCPNVVFALGQPICPRLADGDSYFSTHSLPSGRGEFGLIQTSTFFSSGFREDYRRYGVGDRDSLETSVYSRDNQEMGNRKVYTAFDEEETLVQVVDLEERIAITTYERHGTPAIQPTTVVENRFNAQGDLHGKTLISDRGTGKPLLSLEYQSGKLVGGQLQMSATALSKFIATPARGGLNGFIATGIMDGPLTVIPSDEGLRLEKSKGPNDKIGQNYGLPPFKAIADPTGKLVIDQ